MADRPAHQEQKHDIDHCPQIGNMERNIAPRIKQTDHIADDIACECCDDRALHRKNRDQDRIQHQIDNSRRKAGPEAVSGVSGHGIDAGEELVAAHHQHRDDQHRRIEIRMLICRILAGVDQEIGEDLIECDDAACCQCEQCLIGVIDLRIEFGFGIGIILGDCTHIPRLIEDRRDHRKQIRDLGRCAVDACLRRTDNRLDEDTVREAGNQPQLRGRDQRQRKAQHRLQQLLVNILEAEVSAVLRNAPDADAGNRIGKHIREHKARDAELELCDQNDIGDEEHQRTDDAVRRKELHHAARSCKLCRKLPEAGAKHKADQQRNMRPDVAVKQQQR